jgi:hypothetical protein
MAQSNPGGTRASVRIARVGAMAVVVAVVVSVSSLTNAASSSSLKPVADSWVNSQRPSGNYGSASTLRIDGSPVWHAYLRFDLRSVTGTVTAAQLQLYPNSSSKAGLSVHPVANTTWGEKSITAANAPSIGSAAVSSGSLKAGTTAKIDVGSLVSAGGLVSLALTDNDATAINLASRESSHPPVLVLTFGSATPTPTPLPTATPTPTATPRPTATPTPTATSTPTPTPTPTATPTPTPQPTGAPSDAFPVRAAFYYPWFPESWNQSGMNPFTHYHPSLGFYNGADPAVVRAQIEAMQYGKIGVGIASWWGQGSQTDAKMPTLLSAAANTGFKWTIYYEPEGTSDPSVATLKSDLAYINSHYGADQAFYRIGGKPVIFVYAQPADGCAMASRWAQANASGADYVVLKVFAGYTSCSSQPDDWHQYAPAVAEDHQAGYSFTISPGFYKANESSPRLSRDVSRWTQDVKAMVASHEHWQLITTFNEWGEGTAVESATEWTSASGYGVYLDVLHDN